MAARSAKRRWSTRPAIEFLVRRPPDPDKIKTGVKPDHMVGGNGTDASRGVPPRFEQRPNQEPSAANDEVLREAVQIATEVAPEVHLSPGRR